MQTNLETQQKMFILIEQFKAGEKTLQSFCKEHSIQTWRYYYWQKRYNEHHQPTGFIPVKISSKHKNTIFTPIDIYYPNGVRISVSDSKNLSLLESLIRLG